MDATFKMSIYLGNAAFDEDVAGELSKILRLAAVNIANGNVGVLSNIRDANGNTIGAAVIVND
jgi:hypothetical protein